ncbi:MAG TPA: hypothetical protein VNN23_05165, partial [Ornithinibacter sp.]|nr:hypothetical protein [Ornithinibacter sp.]
MAQSTDNVPGKQPAGVTLAVNWTVFGDTGDSWVMFSAAGLGEMLRPVQPVVTAPPLWTCLSVIPL